MVRENGSIERDKTGLVNYDLNAMKDSVETVWKIVVM